MKLWIEALANLLSNNILQTADNLVGNFLGELLAAIMTEAFRRTVPEEKLGWVNFQNLGNLVYHIRRRKGVAAFYAVDVVCSPCSGRRINPFESALVFCGNSEGWQ